MTALAVAGAAAPAPLGGHLAHVVAGLAFFVLTVGGIAVGEAVQRLRRRERRPVPRSVPLVVMAAASAASAAVHVLVTPGHFREATSYGVFFVATAVGQLALTLLLLTRPSRLVIGAAVVGNLAMVELWLVTRTLGIPLGPEAGHVEALGVLDVLASAFETAVVLAGARLLRRRGVVSRADGAAGAAVRPQGSPAAV